MECLCYVTLVRHVYPLELQKFRESNGTVTVFEEGTIPFPAIRAFLVEARVGETRGAHAHRVCQQLLVAVSGGITVTSTNGKIENVHHLTNSGAGLVIPSMIWATQKYTEPNSQLLVICDQIFDEQDYIREFAEFASLAVQINF